MSDFRKERIGTTKAALLLDLRVTVLKEAIYKEEPLPGGVMPPKPLAHFGRGREMLFIAGDVMDCAEALKKRSNK